MQSRLDDLPDEVLEIIMKFSDRLAALHALVQADDRAQVLLERRPYALLMVATHTSTLETHLLKMYCKSISIRQSRKCYAADAAFRVGVDICLEDQSTAIELDISSTPPSKSIDLLEYAVDVYHPIV